MGFTFRAPFPSLRLCGNNGYGSDVAAIVGENRDEQKDGQPLAGEAQ